MFFIRLERTALALGIFTCFVAGARGQTTRYVDGDASPAGDGRSWSTAYDSLSTALATAQSGDQIWVAGGTYVGNFTLALGVEVYGGFAGTETELTQRDWTANPTILDGGQSGSVVTSPIGATETTRIDGFTITNGSGTVLEDRTFGGGLYLEQSSPTIANNEITGNSVDLSGGGLLVSSASPTIAYNTITDNSAVHGGGINLSGYSAPTIANNTIAGNSASWYGGGLFMMIYSSPTIVNNTIVGNRADKYGGGMYLNIDCAPMIANNTITGNSAAWSGGGMYLRYNSSPTIANNMISGNTAQTDGGGLYLEESSPFIVNTTITGNVVDLGGGGGLYLEVSSPTIVSTIVAFNWSGIRRRDVFSTPTLRYNCVYGNTAYDYSNLTDPTGTDGNISDDPLFTQGPDPGPDGLWGTEDDDVADLHLSAGSPCIGTGETRSIPPDTPDLDHDGDTAEPIPIDLEGHARVLCGDVDMGAYESGIGDHQCDGDVDLDDFTTWDACMTGPGKGPYDAGCEAFDFEYDSDVDLTDFAGMQTRFSEQGRAGR